MLWLGDNDYLRESDWNTWTGICYRFTHGKSLKELQLLFANIHNYTIWDDHDYRPNDADRGFTHKEKTLKAFPVSWSNPGYGTKNLRGICISFQWADVEFFLLDDSWNRSPNNRKTGNRQILGDKQIEWLIDKLSS